MWAGRSIRCDSAPTSTSTARSRGRSSTGSAMTSGSATSPSPSIAATVAAARPTSTPRRASGISIFPVRCAAAFGHKDLGVYLIAREKGVVAVGDALSPAGQGDAPAEAAARADSLPPRDASFAGVAIISTTKRTARPSTAPSPARPSTPCPLTGAVPTAGPRRRLSDPMPKARRDNLARSRSRGGLPANGLLHDAPKHGVQRLAEAVDDLVDVVRRDDERRREQHVVAARRRRSCRPSDRPSGRAPSLRA